METRLKRSTLTGQVEEALKRDIASGALVPGQPLRANDIADRFGVSATPTREALQRLTAQGLVVLDDKHVVRVADVSVKDLEEVYWLRQMLEPVALRLAFERADDSWRLAVAKATEDLRNSTRSTDGEPDPIRWSQAHQLFHRTLFEAADSVQLVRILTNLYHHSERYRMLVRGIRPLDEHGDEHQEIAAHIAAGDVEHAVAALTAHFNRTVTLLRSTGLPATSPARAPVTLPETS